MPTLLGFNGIGFFFYSNENSEPTHVHVTKGSAAGKVWLEALVEIVYLNGFTKAEEKAIIELLKLNSEEFKTKWNEYFKEHI